MMKTGHQQPSAVRQVTPQLPNLLPDPGHPGPKTSRSSRALRRSSACSSAAPSRGSTSDSGVCPVRSASIFPERLRPRTGARGGPFAGGRCASPGTAARHRAPRI